MRKEYEFLTEEQMKKLTTKRLLTYKKKYLKSPDFHFEGTYRAWEDYDSVGFLEKYDIAYKAIKRVLAEREHVGVDNA